MNSRIALASLLVLALAGCGSASATHSTQFTGHSVQSRAVSDAGRNAVAAFLLG